MKTATFETNKGTFTAELYDQDAPARWRTSRS
jgi:cyclophilin family peptidyl-prolyl cis-trans isomerase